MMCVSCARKEKAAPTETRNAQQKVERNSNRTANACRRRIIRNAVRARTVPAATLPSCKRNDGDDSTTNTTNAIKWTNKTKKWHRNQITPMCSVRPKRNKMAAANGAPCAILFCCCCCCCFCCCCSGCGKCTAYSNRRVSVRESLPTTCVYTIIHAYKLH